MMLKALSRRFLLSAGVTVPADDGARTRKKASRVTRHLYALIMNGLSVTAVLSRWAWRKIPPLSLGGRSGGGRSLMAFFRK